MPNKKRRGKRGEDIACRFLEREGYKILERNFRCRQGEIDIVAEDDKDVLCFVEVKSRTSKRFGLPEESVTWHKQRKLTKAAFIYLQKNKVEPRNMRFDIVSIDLKTEETRILRNAFEADI